MVAACWIQNSLTTWHAGIREMQQDVEKNVHTLLQGAFARLDLVTREEFDTQSRVLARTREKLEQLEKIVAGLEAKKP